MSTLEDDEGEDLFPAVTHPTRRAWLIAYILTQGKVGRTCDAVGVSRATHRCVAWKDDFHFQEGLKRAEEIVGDLIEDEAKRRAVDGTRQFQFTKSGAPIKHPEDCECGHHHLGHTLISAAEGKENYAYRAMCETKDCKCERFRGVPYFEHAYSDMLMKTLLQGYKREKYGDKMEVKAALQGIDFNALPNWAIARMVAGENLLSVMLSVFEAAKEEAPRALGPGEVSSEGEG